MQKIKIKSTILVAILVAIFSTIMCMGFVSAEELPSDSIGENIPDLIGGIAKHINYYDKSGALIKTEELLAGNNMTGIEGYEGDYVVRTENYDELHNILSFVVPTEEYVKNNYVYEDSSSTWFLFNNDYDYTVLNINDPSDITCAYIGFVYANGNFQFAYNLNCSTVFAIPSTANMSYYVSIDGCPSKRYENINYSSSNVFTGISLCDNTNMPAPLKYTPNVGRLIEFTSIYDAGMTYSETNDNYMYYYMNETMSLDELSALNMDNVISDTINVYTDIEPAQEPEAPTDDPTDDPSGDENGDIILPPSDKPSDTDKPSGEATVDDQTLLEKSNAQLKSQWTALLAHDWQNAQGWQLITLMIVTLAVVIAIIVTIPIVCHQIKKATNVKRIKTRSAARKR